MTADSKKARLSILIVSGLLLGTAATSYVVFKNTHNGSTQNQQTSASNAVAPNSANQTIQEAGKNGGSPVAHIDDGNVIAPNAANQGSPPVSAVGTQVASVPTVGTQTPSVSAVGTQRASVPATKMWEAVKTAKEEAGRKDPMSPVGMPSRDPISSIESPRPTNHTASKPRLREWRGISQVPPPPNAPGIIDPPVPYVPNPPQAGPSPIPEAAETGPLGANEVRLVGLLDSKAIFRVNRSAVRRLGIPSSFTLGKGQEWGGIKLVNVANDNVTLSDEKHRICTQELSPIH